MSKGKVGWLHFFFIFYFLVIGLRANNINFVHFHKPPFVLVHIFLLAISQLCTIVVVCNQIYMLKHTNKMNLIMLCLSHAATFKPQLLSSKRYNCEVEIEKKKLLTYQSPITSVTKHISSCTLATQLFHHTPQRTLNSNSNLKFIGLVILIFMWV